MINFLEKKPEKPTITEVIESITDVFEDAAIEEQTHFFTDAIPEADLAAFNDRLSRVHKVKKMTYRDLAILFLAFRHNVQNNADGGCPVASLIGFTKAKVDTPFGFIHASKAIAIFIALKLAKVKETHDRWKHKGTTYEIIPTNKY